MGFELVYPHSATADGRVTATPPSWFRSAVSNSDVYLAAERIEVNSDSGLVFFRV